MLVGIFGLTLYVAILSLIPYPLSWVALASGVEIINRKNPAVLITATLLDLVRPIIFGWLVSTATFVIVVMLDPESNFAYQALPLIAFFACFTCTYHFLLQRVGTKRPGGALSDADRRWWCAAISVLPALLIMVFLNASISVRETL